MRTKEELDEAYVQLSKFLNHPDHEDDETLQAIYETLKWFDGYSWDNTVEMYLPS